MSKELLTIESACGDCPKRKFCEFGAPTLQVLEGKRYSDPEKANAVVYLWRNTNVENCPTPGVVREAVVALKQS